MILKPNKIIDLTHTKMFPNVGDMAGYGCVHPSVMIGYLTTYSVDGEEMCQVEILIFFGLAARLCPARFGSSLHSIYQFSGLSSIFLPAPFLACQFLGRMSHFKVKEAFSPRVRSEKLRSKKQRKIANSQLFLVSNSSLRA